ncbi:TonB-dependent receptor P3 [Dyadobacter sp. CECT 9275]|uniref:TonB-dependent receptor P3 n=1 Tax=Dyadobacter helix TaxID=2822344 RepID=A0A916NMF5_9BACT|nr:TonB-dependent receptor [Dyadobacter sp. CECT 9275]CAG5006269.1 TonB-dependent receptor P3 [Dyadobacter sp. CECT 9275]
MKRVTTRYFHHKWTPRSIFLSSLFTVSVVSIFPEQLQAGPFEKGTVSPDANATPWFLERTVKGKVVDEKGVTLPGVNVIIKGTTKGTVTDENGAFSIAVPDGEAILAFSYIGHITQEISVVNQSFLDITLKADTKSLEEVVVVGYGQQKTREVTGSISSLSTAQLQDQPVGQIGQKIQGRIAGVQINQTSGQPGKGISIRIRGAASVNAGNSPLYVVDGAPIVGDINSINPTEIENITVLKGPSAASIYGSRAANGVVLITTKQARPGKTVVQFSVSQGVGRVPDRGRPDLMNAKEFLEFQKGIFEDKIKYEGYAGGIPALYQNPQSWTGPDTDWMDEMLRNSRMSSYNLSLLAGKDKFTSATTVGYYDESGVMLNTGYKRFSLRSNNEYQVNDKIRVGLNVAPTYQTGQNFGTDGTYNIIFAGLTTPPIFSPNEKNADGTRKLRFEGPGLFTQPNWVSVLETSKNKETVSRLLSNAFLEFEFLKNFKFKSAVSTDIANTTNRIFNPSSTGTIWSPPPTIPSGSYSTTNYYSWLTENTLTYSKTFADDHQLEILAGYSAQKFHQEYNSLSGSNFPDDLVSWIDAAAVKNGSNNTTEWSLLSMYSRFNYSFKGKYLLSASIRRDGSSRFGSENRWGAFPSVSAGWIVSDEKFMENLHSLSYLKLRAEYGLVGNFNIGNYSQFGRVSTTNYVYGGALAQGRSLTTLGNNKLTWETTKGIDVGIDISFFNDRLSFTADYYQKSIDDMLYQVDIPMGTGFGNIQSNIGGFKFWGYEFSASTRNLTGALTWNTDFNISVNHNRVEKLGTNNTPIDGVGEQGTYWKTEVGRPIGQFWGYVFDGVYMNQQEFDSQPKAVTSSVGTVRYKDLNGDGVITNTDRAFLGNPNPKFIFGLANSLSYKGLDLNVVISGAIGQDIINGQKEWSDNQDGVFNVQKYWKDRWRSESEPGNGIYPRTTGAGNNFFRYANSRWIEDGSYVTIKNITLGYTLPVLKKVFSRTRATLSCQQAAVFTKYKGMSPEASINGLNGLREGVDAGAYPVPRTFAIGLDLNF